MIPERRGIQPDLEIAALAKASSVTNFRNHPFALHFSTRWKSIQPLASKNVEWFTLSNAHYRCELKLDSVVISGILSRV
jgi:hypothetical protein